MTRPLDLKRLRLARGSHREDSGRMCVMEAVAYVAGDGWTDRPASVSPVISELLRGLNDAMTDVDRQALRSLISVVAGSGGHEELEAARSWMVMDWHCRVWPSWWLRSAGFVGEAAALDGAPAIVDAGTLSAALAQVSSACAPAAERRTAITDGFVQEGLAAAMASARVDEADPVLQAVRSAFATAAGWPSISTVLKSEGGIERWGARRSARWQAAWDVAGYRMAVASGAAQIAAVRALCASSAWQARWDVARAGTEEEWDRARDDARSAARDAALTAATCAAWAATSHADENAMWPIAMEAAATAVRPTVRTLRRSAIGLVADIVDLDLESPELWHSYGRD